MEDDYLADAISLFVERELAQAITTGVIFEKFQALSTRRLQLDKYIKIWIFYSLNF